MSENRTRFRLNQNRAPIYEALEQFRKMRVVPFDVPGHKRGRGNPELTAFLGQACVGVDVNSMKPLDNLCHPVSVIREAEELAADAFGAAHAFLMVGGTTSSVQSMVLTVCKRGDEIILPRNVHRSVLNALVLCGAVPVYVNPEVDQRLGISLGMKREQVEKALTLAKAAAAHDSYAAAVLLAAVIEAVSGASIDGFVGLAVSLFILYSGAKLAKETISPLLGEAASPELQSRIVDYISAQPKVLGYHDLMVHDYGPGQRFATIHVEMDSKEDPMRCHELIDDMERECLKSHNIHLVIHYDPVVTDDPELTRLHILVDGLLAEMDSRLKTHDFRMVPGGGHTNLIFDIAVPQDIKLTKQDIQSRLEEALRTREDKIYHTVITFDPIAFNQESCEHLPNGQ